MARGCKVTLYLDGPTALEYVVQSCAVRGWTVHPMGDVDGTDLTIVFVRGPTGNELKDHLKADQEFDFSQYN
jgi:hypothetical protein